MAGATNDDRRRYWAGGAPLLLCALAGNPATSAAILACLNTVDASRLRRLHPAVAAVVTGVPWCDTSTPLTDTVRWRAALPAAVGARLVDYQKAGGRLVPVKSALAALAGVMHLDLQDCWFVTDKVLLRLPPSLRTLNVCKCPSLTEHASFVQLTALTELDCRFTSVVRRGVAGLPASLQVLDISSVYMQSGSSLAHLACLRVLRARGARLDTTETLASLSPSLLELHCHTLPSGASFAHLPALHTLDVSLATFDDASLATLPPSLAFLNVSDCKNLTPAAELPHLPALRLLDVSRTGVGDALVGSLPAGLTELRMVDCRDVTAGATLDHVPALHALHSYGTDLAPGVLAACRARGCAVPAAGVLYGVVPIALLADGRLAGGGGWGAVQLWDVAAGDSEAGVALTADSNVSALAALHDGHRLAIGGLGAVGFVEIWEVEVVPPVRTATVACSGGGVWELLVLYDGRLAAGCSNNVVQIIDANACIVAATLEGHTHGVAALATLPGGELASGSLDDTVRLWDVDTQVCVATLEGHSGGIHALAVLANGRLASGSNDGTVRLWDVGTRTCAGVLTGHTDSVSALAALPDGRLASGSSDGTVRVWDTRPAAAVGGRHAAGIAPTVTCAHALYSASALVPLPDGRLASAAGGKGVVYLLHLPPPVTY